MIEAILGTSIALQVAAIAIALRLGWLTAQHWGWAFVALALGAMLARGLSTAWHLVNGNGPQVLDARAEWTALAVSVCLVTGLLLLFPFFAGLARAEAARKEADQVLRSQLEEVQSLYQASLRESEARKGAHLATALVAIVTIDDAGRIVEFNGAAELLFGHRAGDVLGRELAPLLIPEAMREAHRHGFARHLQTGSTTILGRRVEMNALRADGTEVPVELTVTRVPIEGRPLFTAHLRDLSPVQRSRADVRDREARLSAIVDTAVDAILTIDERGTVETLNPAAQALFGYGSSQVVGRNIKMLMPPPYSNEHDEYLARYLRTGEKRIIGSGRDVTGRRADGSTFPLHLTVSEMTVGGRRMFTGIARDITPMKAAERALRDRAEELARSNRELEQFAYVASHDLQEPLRMIASFTQLLAQRQTAQGDAEAEEFVGYVTEGVSRMQAFIEGLLRLSRVGRGSDFAPVDCNVVLEECLPGLRVAMEEAGATVTWAELPAIRADALQIANLFQNLIGNAIKFRSRARPPHVHVSVERETSAWLFRVRDNGIGIEQQYAARLFVIFQRLHGRDEYPGTGIGLALCKKIVERHGGTIWFESVPGEGTTFLFRIPDEPEARP